MECGNPILCYRTSTGAQYRHFNLATRLFKNFANARFDCGQCIFCRKKRATELATRCVLHASLYTNNCFLTLTYDEKIEGYHNDFQYKDIQDFKKKIRSHCKYHFNKPVQLFNVHEYGRNGKKHWHLVLFNHDFTEIYKKYKGRDLHTTSNGNRLYTSGSLSSKWTHGFSTIGSVTEASAMYQAQYTQKDLKNGNLQNAKKAHSKHSGIGRDYFLLHYKQILNLGFIPFNGRRTPVPRYFQKLAHKHYSHFYEPGNFFDYPDRKKLYSPFTTKEPNREIAELYKKFSTEKQIQLEQLNLEWNIKLQTHLDTNEPLDSTKSMQNYIYDLNNKQTVKDF